MCVNPNMLSDGTEVACRKCNQCKRQIINDWAGRIIAESKTTPVTYYVTLTYGPDENGDKDHIRSAVLTYSDIQNYLKRIRFSYGKFRYFVVGEYGEERGRSHWHLILFAQKEYPGVVLNDIFNVDKKWPHGTSLWKKFQTHHAYYCCKYVFKDYKDDLKVAKISMSKKPPLGDAYFKSLAMRHVRQGLAPQHNFYTFREVVERSGKQRRFRLRAKSLENYCAEFVAQWRANYPWRAIPKSAVIEDYLEKKAEHEYRTYEFDARLEAAEKAAYNRQALERHFGRFSKTEVSFQTAHYQWGIVPGYYFKGRNPFEKYQDTMAKINAPKSDGQIPFP